MYQIHLVKLGFNESYRPDFFQILRSKLPIQSDAKKNFTCGFFQSTTYITLSLQVLIEFEQKIPKGTEAQDSKITCNNILVQDWVVTENMSLDFPPHQTFFNNYVGSNNLCTYAHFSCKNLNTGILKSIKRKCIDIFKYFNDLT